MRVAARWLILPVASLLACASARAWASEPTGGCTEQTYGAACDHGDGNACSGICQPDFSTPGAPMACAAVSQEILSRLGLPSSDGLACSPAGQPGTDCAHACSGGQCVGQSAADGAACVPADVDAGPRGIGPPTICQGACKAGVCADRTDHPCDKYGRSELSFCLYAACNPLNNTAYCVQFGSPVGTPCQSGLACMQNEVCTAQKSCLGTPVPGCTPPVGGADGGTLAAGSSSGESSTGGSTSSGGGGSSGSSSKGCAVGGSDTAAGAFMAAVMFAFARRRRARGTESTRSRRS